MNEPLKRLQACVSHLLEVDAFFNTEDALYKDYRRRLVELKEIYDSFSKAMYEGNFGRQMQLADLLTYMIISRGSIWAVDSGDLSNYMRIVFFTINQLLLQEHITAFPDQRKKFMNHLEERKLHFFIEDEKYRQYYEEAKKSQNHLTYREHKRVYWAADHLLPKSVGTAIELAVFLYLIRNKVGYVIPLLLQQRLLALKDHLIAPDFLVAKRGRIFGIEVEQAARTGKTRQSNAFMAETGIPVLTASILDTFPLRCYECRRWILYCDNIIDKFCDLAHKIESDQITCDSCNQVVYYGRLKKGDDEYHYHLECAQRYRYVRELLEDEKQSRKRLVAYFPSVGGLERVVPSLRKSRPAGPSPASST